MNNSLETSDVNKLTPFLNSIGVGGFIIINRGCGDELVMGFRSKASCQSGGYWHFSYDETFTQDDKIGETGDPSFEGCMLRAIDEELGISEQEREICGINTNIRFLDAGVIKTSGDDNRFEFEVCGFGRVAFSKRYTFEDFCRGYRFAKDAEIETQTLSFINIKHELGDFIETANFKGEISPEAYHLAKNISLLYELKILDDDFWDL